MKEDLSGPEPGHGFGGLDHYKLYTVYRLLDPSGAVLGNEIDDVRELVEQGYRTFDCDQDLGLGEWPSSAGSQQQDINPFTCQL